MPVQPGEDLLRVGHLRHGLWVHEGADLNLLHPCFDNGIQQFELLARAEDSRLDLQAVAWADLHQVDALGQLPHRARHR